MKSLRRPAEIYFIAVVLIAAVLPVPLLGQFATLDADRALLALLFAGFMVLAYLFPLDFTFKTKLLLDTSVLIAVILIFPPGVAMVIAGAGVLVAHAVRRADRVQALFNAAQCVLQAAVGGSLLQAAHWDSERLDLLRLEQVLILVVVTAAIYLTNTLLVATMVGLDSELPLGHVWRQSIIVTDYAERLGQVVFGLVAALVVESSALAAPLLLAPGIALHRVLARRAARQTMDDVVDALADIVDLRDPFTAGHSQRVARYTRELAIELGLPMSEVGLFERAARVHDIGKISIEREILAKDQSLTGDEWVDLKQHPTTGAEIVARFPRFALAAPLVRHHHERVDGTGYPDGLHGTRIPLGARVIAAADALDAMASPRPFRPGLPAEAILAEFRRQRGRQWDDEVVDALLRLVERGTIVLPGSERVEAYLALDAKQPAADSSSGLLEGLGLNALPDSERSELEQQLVHRAFHDPLTDLPNRALFIDRLEHALARIRRAPDAIAVLFLDLDNFKHVNDTLGHQAGDQLLLEVAQRLSTCVRPGDTVARLAGDEFTLLLETIDDMPDAVAVAERILDVLRPAFVLGGQEVHVTPSIGIALSTSGQDRADELLNQADVAMYRVKHEGKAGYRVFDSSMRAHALRRRELEQEIQLALARDELRVHYQPMVLLDSGRIVGVEALLRWEHPQRGMMLPAEFLDVAEESGAILEIGEWVLQQACRQLRAWQARLLGTSPLVVSVNLSTRQFQQRGLVELVGRTLSEHEVDPRHVLLEISEQSTVGDPDGAAERLRDLKQLGVQLAIDDFGVGTSVMSELKRYPVDTLKISRTFIDGLGYDPGDTAIVRAVIAFSRALGRTVTAEGIETAHQFAQLRALGCDRGQGYYFARPVSGDAITTLVAAAAPFQRAAMVDATVDPGHVTTIPTPPPLAAAS